MDRFFVDRDGGKGAYRLLDNSAFEFSHTYPAQMVVPAQMGEK